MCTFLVTTDFDKVFSNQLKDPCSLLNAAHREQFLAEIIAVSVDHNVRKFFVDVLEEKFHYLGTGLYQLVLQIARA